MSLFRFLSSALLAWAILSSTIVLSVHGHGGGHGGHGGFGHAGFHHGFGYGGYHGFHGFGYGYRGIGFGYPFYGGFGYPFFGGFGYPFFGGFGYGLYGLGYGLYGFSGLGYGLYGLGGLGYGGLGFHGFGYGGYGYSGPAGACNCCCLSAYPYYGSGAYPLYGGGVPIPGYGDGNAPAGSNGDSLPMPKSATWNSRYVDYYARNTYSAVPPAVTSNSAATRYVDYYSRNAGLDLGNKALLHVSLPADAELWLNGKRMERTGPERDFISPQLREGETYVYEIKARWTQDGRLVEDAVEVKVRANKTSSVRLGTSSLAKR